MTLSAAEGYISQTPLKVLLREGFTACRVKSSLHLYNWRRFWHGVEMQRRLHKGANMLHTGTGAYNLDVVVV